MIMASPRRRASMECTSKIKIIKTIQSMQTVEATPVAESSTSFQSSMLSTLSTRGRRVQSALPKDLYERVAQKSVSVLSLTQRLLVTFCKKYLIESADPEVLKRTPRQEYSHEVCHALASYLNSLITRKDLSPLHFREEVENLYYLVRFFQKSRHDLLAAKTLAILTSEIISCIDVLTVYLEKLSNLPVTTWGRVRYQIQKEFDKRISTDDVKMPYDTRPFALDKVLGVGGFGVVHRAKFGNSYVCIKFVSRKSNALRYSYIDRLVASMINHPFIVQYFTSFVTVEAYVTVMEYIRGVDVTKVLKDISVFPDKATRLIIAQLGVAVQHMHYKGFVHRDIKPANMMILPGCQIRLIDFDTARCGTGKFHVVSLESFFKKTSFEWERTDVCGTLPYIAPEGLRRKGYGRALDWWAVGITLYELSTGETPFARKCPEELKKAILSGVYTWPKRRFPVSLCEFVESLLKTDPAERFCSKSYQDLFEHVFFTDINWRWLESTSNLMDFEPITKIMARSTESKNEFSPIPSPKCAEKIKKHFDTEPTTPVPVSEQPKLLTFASSGFQRAYTKLQGKEIPQSSDLKEEPDFQFRFCGEGYTFKDHLINVKDTLQTIEIVRVKGFLTWPAFGFSVVENVHDDVIYLTVAEIVPDSPAEKAGLVLLDVIITANDTSVVGMNKMAFMKMIKACDAKLCLAVSKLNVYRMLVKRGAVDLTGFDTSEIRVSTTKKTTRTPSDFGLRAVGIAAHYKKGREYIHVYLIVSEILKALRIVKFEPLYPTLLAGDVIISVNGKNVTADNYGTIFGGSNRFADICFAPLSAVRRDHIALVWCSILGSEAPQVE